MGLPPAVAARGPGTCGDKQLARLTALFAAEDPREIQVAWAAKECLRQLLNALPATRGPLVVDRRRAGTDGQQGCPAGLRPYEIRARLERFYRLAAASDLPELHRLAATVETWWPAVEALQLLRVTNAKTEGYNRKIKQVKQVACGFRNQQAYECRPPRLA